MVTKSKKLLNAVQNHPIGTAAIVGGAVVGAVLIGKAVNTAARVATIKVAADAATNVARAVRGPAKGTRGSAGGGARTSKARKATKPSKD